jgi:hypothetical protein
MQVFVGFDRGGMITVFPERPVSILPLVVFLCRSPGDELHTLRDNILTGVFHQQVDVVGCHYVVQYTETEPLLGLETQCKYWRRSRGNLIEIASDGSPCCAATTSLEPLEPTSLIDLLNF